jgi:hypothetical protein
MRFAAAVLVASALGVFTPAYAQEGPYGQWEIQGIGIDSCASFLNAESTSPPGKSRTITYPDGTNFFTKNYAYGSWIQGFLTAVGLESSNSSFSRALASPDYAGIDLWLQDWCKANPDKPLYDAVSAFVRRKQSSLSTTP